MIYARSDWSRISSYLDIITLARGGALIFEMAATRFLDVCEEEKKTKIKENTVALIKLNNYSSHAQWILSNNPLDFVSILFDNIHFVIGE